MSNLKAVLVIGKTGRGKSSFIKHCTGLNVPTSDAPEAHTSTVNTYRVGDLVFIDTPGTGDNRNGLKLTNEVILSMILKKIRNSNIICIVVMVEQSDFQTRIEKDTKDLIEMIKSRFNNYERICCFGVKDEFENFSVPKVTKVLAKYPKRIHALHELGITVTPATTNVFVCPNNHDALFAHVRKVTGRRNPYYLISKPKTEVNCRKCKITADPLLINDNKCYYHVSKKGEMKHGRTEMRHASEQTIFFHPGSYNNSKNAKHYNCCRKNDQGCKEVFKCCRGVAPCQRYCTSCNRQSNQIGCVGLCDSCQRPLTTRGCIVNETHEI